MSDAELAQLAAEEEFESAYDRALTFLEQRPRSQAEVRRKLAGKKIAPETIERVIARLTAAGLLNDREFVQLWIESRENFKPRAGQALRMELRQKGVSPALIDEAVKELDEGESAYRAAVTRAPRYHNLERKEFRDKLSAFLLRRGFSYEVVKETVERVWRETRGELVD
jgi:regulatory protein